jgi:hypothetical protein
MPTGSRAEFLTTQSAEATGAILAAVLRDPLDTPEKRWAADMWKGSVEKLRPDDVALQELREGLVDWLHASLASLSAVIGAGTGFHSKGQATRDGNVIEGASRFGVDNLAASTAS